MRVSPKSNSPLIPQPRVSRVSNSPVDEVFGVRPNQPPKILKVFMRSQKENKSTKKALKCLSYIINI